MNAADAFALVICTTFLAVLMVAAHYIVRLSVWG
jgi:hypothetical protein